MQRMGLIGRFILIIILTIMYFNFAFSDVRWTNGPDEIFAEGDNVYFSGENGIFVYDISNPESPNQIARCGLVGYSMIKEGDTMYVNSYSKIKIYDYQIGEEPQLLSSVEKNSGSYNGNTQSQIVHFD